MEKSGWKIACAILAFALFVGSSNICEASQDTEKTWDLSQPMELGGQEGKNVRVAILNYPNYMQIEENGKAVGYACDYLDEIAEYTGWDYEYVQMSLAEAVAALEEGSIDILPGVQVTQEREEFMDFSDADMGTGGTVLCSLSGNTEYAFNDFEKFDGMRVAVLRGSIRRQEVIERFAMYGAVPKMMEYSTDAECKEALQKAEVDAIAMSDIRCTEYLKMVARVSNRELYFGLNQNDSSIKEQIDMAMEEIHLRDPYYEAGLYEKYYGGLLEQVSLSSEEIAYVENAGVIKVAIFDGMRPIEYYDKKSDSFEGMIVDTYRLIEEYTGLKFEFVQRGNSNALLSQMKSGEIQLVGEVVDDEEMADYYEVRLTDPFFQSSITAVVNKKVKDYQATDIKLALYANTPLYIQTAEKLGYQNIVYFDSYESCIKAVNKGNVQMTFIPTYCRDRLVNHSYLKEISSFTLPDSDYEFCIGVSKNVDRELYSILNKAVASINQEKRNQIIIDNMSADNSGGDNWKDFLSDNTAGILGGGLIAVCLIALAMGHFLQERKKTNKNLQKMIEEAEYASQAKNDFLSRMSHDMRTPMNAIIGMSALGADETKEVSSREYFQNIHLSADFLLGLINDVLDTSKMENDDFTLAPEVCSVSDFVNQVESTIVPLCKKKEIEFVFEREDSGVKYIWMDRLRFEQIIFNLLTNAVKFTPSGGRVELRMEFTNKTENRVSERISICDNGIGMSPQFMQHMYEPFAQEHSTLIRRTDGSGLGLTIVKKLVELMGGTIQCNSEQGKGTEFIIDIELLICEGEKLQNPVSKVAEEKQQEDSSYHLAGKRVLLCEDHPLNTQIAKKLLEKQGMLVDCAENGEEGVQAFVRSKTGDYAAILMDIRMPVMDGLTAAERIRNTQREDALTVPIIAMTANAYEEDKEKSRAAGMNEHLAKPIEPKVLYDTLEKNIYVQNQCSKG